MPSVYQETIEIICKQYVSHAFPPKSIIMYL